MIHLIVIGAGAHAYVVREAAEASGRWRFCGYADTTSTGANDARWRGEAALRSAQLAFPDAEFVVGIGSCSARWRISAELRSLGCRRATVIHPRAHVERSAQLAPGVFIAAMAVVGARVQVGESSIINTGAIVDHDCSIGEAVHVAPGSTLGGAVVIGDRSWIGLGASISNGIRVAPGCLVGAGSVVVRDVSDPDSVAYGNPARCRRAVNPEDGDVWIGQQGGP